MPQTKTDLKVTNRTKIHYLCLVRFFSFILAIYFLGLSMMTCDDAAMAADNCQTISCMHLDAGHEEDHSADSCSPLCTCSCCGGVTLVYEYSQSIKADHILPLNPLYSESSISEISFSIWQPPKIS